MRKSLKSDLIVYNFYQSNFFMKKIIIFCIILFATGAWFIHFRTYNTVSDNIVPEQFVVAKGDDIITIGSKLATQDLVANRIYFYYYAWKNKLRGSIDAGNYLITPKSSIADIVYKMTTGDAVKHIKKDVKITFPEGWTIKQMANRLNENNLAGDAFSYLAYNPMPELYTEYPFLQENKSLEGYLFPDTYFFMPDATAEDVVRKMLDNFDIKVDEGRRKIIADSGKSLHDTIIFASIIEGEVPSGADRQIVAGVFKNRLDIGIALQSDATIDYIKGVSELKHTQADIEIDSPYNTYKYPGLPRGPINNPSLKSIDAAIAPADTDYMYFLNNVETGETVFSKSLDEHNINKGLNGL